MVGKLLFTGRVEGCGELIGRDCRYDERTVVYRESLKDVASP